ncbi:MAG: DUF4365 domain-containing protein [Desulfarculaceae bacterium]|nr:DUF4365 domain-containing protein [Desulfarculaceae bacterium]MCF8073591.1 DUF4365 domain-containing protein [Desulfarculaceae bacterium]MCF8103748.1 DUF4365 domain-containing protein [Desulfarculaceae bacterium]MCF8115693.1 DUF4365 domain-containing protein [Desulfarculaceae bacterium]
MDLPKRPRQHSLEDESIREFERLLPSNWVFRRHAPDYGTDGEVEVFSEEGTATGKKFNIQIKATDFGGDDPELKIKLKTDTCRYFMSLDLPVLLVGYCSPTKTIYVKWFHHVQDISRIEANKYVTEVFSQDDIWSESSSNTIIESIDLFRKIKSANISTPLPASLHFTGSTVFGKNPRSIAVTLETHLRDFPSLLKFNNIYINPATEINNVDLVNIIFDENNLDILLAGIHLVKVPQKNIAPPDKVEIFISDILFAIGKAFIRAGHHEIACQFIENSLKTTSTISEVSWFFDGAHCLAARNRFDVLIDFIKSCATREDMAVDSEVASIFLILYFDNMSSEQKNNWRDAMYAVLGVAKKHGDGVRLAALHYSIGNMLRKINLKQALKHYSVARKIEPDYTNRDYFWRDIGGLLFELHKFSHSYKAYSCAYNLSNDEDLLLLQADSLMYTGRYKEAQELFANLSFDNDSWQTYWHLKEYCLSQIIKATSFESQQREEASCRHILNKFFNNSFKEEQAIDVINHALNLDALNSTAWFNLGVSLSKQNHSNDAFNAFLIASILSINDSEAWCNAILLGFFSDVKVTFILRIISAAYEICGNDLFSTFDSFEESQTDKEEYRNIIDRVYEVVQTIRTSKTIKPTK